MKKLENSIWIAKPPRASCGNGIVLLKDAKEIPDRKNPLSVQRYITNPLLISECKQSLQMVHKLVHVFTACS